MARFPILDDDDLFEKLCRDLLRLHWNRPELEIFGKRGERQYGIDILDLSGIEPIYAAQCKLREEHKSLPPSEIQAEVEEAEKFVPPLGKYAILTTGKISTQSQRKIREINQAHKASGLFEVELITWETICELLEKYSEVQEIFYNDFTPRRVQKFNQQLVAIDTRIGSLSSRFDGDEIDTQINEARDCITKHECQLATLLLNHVLRDKGERLSQRQRFRALTNLGAAALGSGKPETAAKFFLQALPLQPDDELARINEVFAFLLVDDHKNCHEKATTLRQEYPASPRLTALWLSSAPKDIPMSSLEGEINSVLRLEPEVSLALSRRALTELEFERASAYAATAAQFAPMWAQPHIVLAQVNLGKALHELTGFTPKNNERQNLLVDAENHCGIALELAHKGKDIESQKMALVLRADIRLILRKPTLADDDAKAAEKLDADDPQVIVAVAQVNLSSNRLDPAIACLKRAYQLQPDPNIAFMYGRTLLQRASASDLTDALSVFVQVPLGDVRPEIRATFATQTFQAFALNKDWPGAETYLERVAPCLDPAIVATIRGYIAHYQTRSEDAGLRAREAASQLTPDSNPHTKEYLARLLMLLGKPADALPLWQELFENGSPTLDPGTLLNCAARLHRDDVVLRTCDELHARGTVDWKILEFEVSYLEKYQIEIAIERLQEFIKANPDHKLAVLRLSLIGLGLRRIGLVHGNPDGFPAVEEIPVGYIVPAVQVMKYGGYPDAALEYAYQFLRRNFGELRAHQALIVSMIPGSCAPNIPPTLEVVGPDSAVCYQEIPQGPEIWVVLENTDKPVRDFEEITLTSPLASALLGKKVGDVVLIAKAHTQDRTAQILQIVPKHVRRYQDSMGEMQVRFGAASTVESIKLTHPSPDDPQGGLGVILADVERRAAAVAGAREAYNTLPASLHWYGDRFGRGAYEGLLSLASEDSQTIKCCFGTPQEREQALSALRASSSVVVDITALATLRLLDLERVLSSTKFRFTIAQQTWISFQEMLFAAQASSSVDGGTLLFRNGKHLMYEQTAEEKARRLEEDKAFVEFVGQTTAIRSAVALASVEPDKREALENFFGPYGAESIILAGEPTAILWTDDLIQAQIAAQEFGCHRVWTQLLLGYLAEAGLVTVQEYTEASAKLLGMEFVATQFDGNTMIAAFRLAGWSADERPAKQIVSLFSNPGADLQGLLRALVGFAIALYREPILGELKCAVTKVLLRALAQRPEAMPLLTSIRKASQQLFGLNEIGRAQFDKCFDSWLREGDKPLIVIP
jgi:tetratricopeptide (TPR) repeat protein